MRLPSNNLLIVIFNGVKGFIKTLFQSILFFFYEKKNPEKMQYQPLYTLFEQIPSYFREKPSGVRLGRSIGLLVTLIMTPSKDGTKK